MSETNTNDADES